MNPDRHQAGWERIKRQILNDRRQIWLWRGVAGILAVLGAYLYLSAK